MSGLATARALRARGARVVLLEARERVGGRTESARVGKGTFDLGGQWLGAGQRRLQALVGELGLRTFPQFHAGKKVLDLGGRLSTYSGTIPKIAPHKLLELHLTLRKLDKAWATVPVDDPRLVEGAGDFDDRTLDEYARAEVRSRDVREIFAAAVRVVFGAEMRELSVLYFLWYLRSGGGLMRLVEIEKGAQETRFVDGAQSVSDALANEVGDALVRSSPVRRVAQDESSVAVFTETHEYRAKRVIVAVPPPMIQHIDFQPALPAVRAQLQQRMPMGGTVKCLALYPRAFWREQGMSGEAVFDRGPISVTFDATSHDGAQPALLAFVVGDPARTWSTRSLEERRRVVTDTFVRLFGAEAKTPSEYVEKDWSDDPWARGCPVAIMGPGVASTTFAALRRPVGRVHWAGTETATEWAGYIEGALEAAERVTREVAAKL